MEAPDLDAPPKKLAGYELLRPLGRGGMATLYLARREGAAGFERQVAIKVVHPFLADDKNFVQMFLDEARLSSRINHPNVVHVEELGESEGLYFMVMEYVRGCSLSAVQKELARRQRGLKPALAVHTACELAAGLHAAHSVRDDGGPLGLVHRDVSPQNVLLSTSGHIKLIDFGIAKARGANRSTSGSIKGKIRYMSPEQAFGRELDARSDVYALGVVLWELLTMQRLFSAKNDIRLLERVRDPSVPSIRELAPDVPEELERVVLNLLAPDRSDRPESAWEARRLLYEALPSAREVEAPHLSSLVDAVLQPSPAEERSGHPTPSAVGHREVAREDSEQAIAEGTMSIPLWDSRKSPIERDDLEEVAGPGVSPPAPRAVATRTPTPVVVQKTSFVRMLPWLIAASALTALAIVVGPTLLGEEADAEVQPGTSQQAPPSSSIAEAAERVEQAPTSTPPPAAIDASTDVVDDSEAEAEREATRQARSRERDLLRRQRREQSLAMDPAMDEQMDSVMEAGGLPITDVTFN